MRKVMGMGWAAVMATAVVVGLGLAGCAKKSGQEAIPEKIDTLSVQEAVPEKVDTLSVKYDTLTDERDGKIYRNVKIGNQTWMAENLNYETDSSWCYENRPDSCSKYGRLYTWNAAKKACPVGWHLPSRAEWEQLGQTVGSKRDSLYEAGWHTIEWVDAGTNLKSKAGWNNGKYGPKNANGNDMYGFSAMASGMVNVYNIVFEDSGINAYWWTSTVCDTSTEWNNATSTIIDYSYYIHIGKYGDLDVNEDHDYFGRSVRCIQDAATLPEPQSTEEQ